MPADRKEPEVTEVHRRRAANWYCHGEPMPDIDEWVSTGDPDAVHYEDDRNRLIEAAELIASVRREARREALKELMRLCDAEMDTRDHGRTVAGRLGNCIRALLDKPEET